MTVTGSRILVVDDEPSITQLLATALRREGFEVREAATGRSALRETVSFRPDLLVLDVLLPDLDGLAVTTRLRQNGHRVAILLLTALDTTEDKIAGLTAGADDYLTKPFHVGEVVARVRAILRRPGMASDAGSIYRVGDLVLDDVTHEVWRAEVSVQLTATEFALLRVFLRHPRLVLSRAQIIEHLWPDDPDRDQAIVEAYVFSLRRKLDRHGPQLIQTVPRLGYSLRPAEPSR